MADSYCASVYHICKHPYKYIYWLRYEINRWVNANIFILSLFLCKALQVNYCEPLIQLSLHDFWNPMYYLSPLGL